MGETNYKIFATEVRRLVLQTLHNSGGSHTGSNLSIVDIISVLYNGVLTIDPKNPYWKERDRFILSKGHACLALYATLALKGFFPSSWLSSYYQNGGKLAGHVTHKGVPGVEVSTGSLGHGLPLGCGMALAAKRARQTWRTFVLLSDGELDEGSNWEPILFAPHHRLDNLVVIIDYNKLQSLVTVKETLNLEPLAQKWEAFGWSVAEVDGHDTHALEETFSKLPFGKGKPNCIIAHTTKGKGISFMENNNLWHYRAPDKDELAQALEELEEATRNKVQDTKKKIL